MPGGRWQLLSDDRGTSVPVSVSAQLFRGEQTCVAAVGGIRLLSGSPGLSAEALGATGEP